MTKGALKAARTTDGYTLLVEGRGTVNESPAVKAFAERVMSDPTARLQLDLSTCVYLDSTFLGCVVSLSVSYGRPPQSRFTVYSPSRECWELFASNHLDKAMTIVSEKPTIVGEPIALEPTKVDPRALTQLVIESHRQLAQLGGNNAATFAAIAKRAESEAANAAAAGKLK